MLFSGLLGLSVLAFFAFVHYLTLLCPDKGAGRTALQIGSTSCRGSSVFVYLNFALWGMQPLIRGFRRLQRGMGPGPMVSTSMDK